MYQKSTEKQPCNDPVPENGAARDAQARSAILPRIREIRTGVKRSRRKLAHHSVRHEDRHRHAEH